jgi:hypothetical protein
MATVIKKILFTFACLLSFSIYADGVVYFVPPQGWNLANPEMLKPRVKIGFLGQSTKGLLPSVNLATERVTISLQKYIEIIKKDYQADPNCHWRDLGQFKTPLGEGRLTQHESQTEWGIARVMQLVVIHHGTAYVLTTGALKEEFSKHYKDFEAVFSSLTLTTDLIAEVKGKEKRAKLVSLVEGVKSGQAWDNFQNSVINDFTEMGPYWQILLLQDIRDGITRK